MSEISRAAVFGRLNKTGYQAIEGATVFCKLRGNPVVEPVHWFLPILNLQDSDLHRITRHFGLDPARLAADMTNFPTAWRAGHLLPGMLATQSLTAQLPGMSQEFARLRAEDLAANFDEITAGSLEAGQGDQAGGGAAPGAASGAIAPAQMGREEVLQKFCTDQTAGAGQAESTRS